MRQDRQLDGIERGLGTLQEIGLAMGQALEHQDVLTDAIVEKVSSIELLTVLTVWGHTLDPTRETEDSLLDTLPHLVALRQWQVVSSQTAARFEVYTPHKM